MIKYLPNVIVCRLSSKAIQLTRSLREAFSVSIPGSKGCSFCKHSHGAKDCFLVCWCAWTGITFSLCACIKEVMFSVFSLYWIKRETS